MVSHFIVTFCIILGAVMGIPGAPQVVPGSIPGLPAVFPAGMDVLQQNPAEAERILAAR